MEELRRKTHQQEMNVKEHIVANHLKCPFFGYPRMQIALKKGGAAQSVVCNGYYVHCVGGQVLFLIGNTGSFS
jgi:hypothetical protein